MSFAFVWTKCLAYRSSPPSFKGKDQVIRLLYGKRRNILHKYSAGKPGVVNTLLLPTTAPSSGLFVENVSPLQDLHTSCSAFIYGVQQAFSVGELGRAEVLSLLQRNRKLQRLDYSRALWEWCTTPIRSQEQKEEELPQLMKKNKKGKEMNEEEGEEGHSYPKEECGPSTSFPAVKYPARSTVLPPQAALWTAAHDAVLMSHMNDIGGTVYPHSLRASWMKTDEKGRRLHSPLSHLGETSASISAFPPSSSLSSRSLVQQVYQRAMQQGRGGGGGPHHRALLGALLKAYAKEDNWRGALRAYQTHILRDRKLSDNFHLHIVMNVCRRCGMWEEGIQLFQMAVTGKQGGNTLFVQKKGKRKGVEKGDKTIKRTEGGGKEEEESSSLPMTGVPVIPHPNAVVYLELLRLIAQSPWPHRYATARGIVNTLHYHSSHSQGDDKEEEEEEPEEVGKGKNQNLHYPPPSVSALAEERHSIPSTTASTSSSGNNHATTPLSSSSPFPFPTRKKMIPIQMTAGHYNAVLLSLKPSHRYSVVDMSKSRTFQLYDQLMWRRQPLSFSTPPPAMKGEMRRTTGETSRRKRNTSDEKDSTTSTVVGSGQEESRRMTKIRAEGKKEEPEVRGVGWLSLLQPSMETCDGAASSYSESVASYFFRSTEKGKDNESEKEMKDGNHQMGNGKGSTSNHKHSPTALIPYFLSPPFAPSHVREGWLWYHTMKRRNIQPSKETLPTLLSLHPRHLLHVLCCIAECHRLAFPVTVEMYRAALLCFISPSYVEYMVHHVQKVQQQKGGGNGDGWPVENGGSSLPLLDAVGFVEAEYKRYETFERKEEHHSPSLLSEEVGEKGNDEENGEDVGEMVEEIPCSSSLSVTSCYSTSPDMLGLHLSTALVDVLLAHPRPREAEYWLALFAPRLRPLLSALSFGICDRLGVESVGDLFSTTTSSPSTGSAAAGCSSHRQLANETVTVGSGVTAPSSSSFFWQVHGRVAVVDHNVLLSPLFESLFFHYDAVFIPFSSLRVLVRRLKELRPNSVQAKYTRRALRALRERIISSSLSSSSNQGKEKDPVSSLPLYVIPLAHQVYAHRYLEGLSPVLSSSSTSDPNDEQKKNAEDENKIEENKTNPSPLPSPSPLTLSERLLDALRQAPSSAFDSPRDAPTGRMLVYPSSISSFSPFYSGSISTPATEMLHLHGRTPSNGGQEKCVVSASWGKETNTCPLEKKEPRASLIHHQRYQSREPHAFQLHHPQWSISMPERVLAVACMLKTLNPEASVHVLSSSSALHPRKEKSRRTAVSLESGSTPASAGQENREGWKSEERKKDSPSGGEWIRTVHRSQHDRKSALEEVVNRWNLFQSKSSGMESKSFGKGKSKNHQAEGEMVDEDVESSMFSSGDGALRLTHVYHPTELAEKAPSELQLPPSSMR